MPRVGVLLCLIEFVRIPTSFGLYTLNLDSDHPVMRGSAVVESLPTLVLCGNLNTLPLLQFFATTVPPITLDSVISPNIIQCALKELDSCLIKTTCCFCAVSCPA